MPRMPIISAPSTVLWKIIDEQILTGTAATITFSGISSSFVFFRMYVAIIKDGTPSDLLLTLNNDGSTNYDEQRLSGSSTSITGIRNVSQESFSIANLANIGANNVWAGLIIIGKPVADKKAQLHCPHGYRDGSDNVVVEEYVGEWNNVADLIDRIDFDQGSGNFAIGTLILLEGASVT